MSKTPRRRKARKARVSGSIDQSPWETLRYQHAPTELLSADVIEQIHQAGAIVLVETGMVVLSSAARDAYRRAGCRVENERVFFDPDLLNELLSTAPSTITLQARNPARNIRLGEGNAVFTSVGGPAYVMDIDRGRRSGTYAEMCDSIRLVQSLDISA